MKRRAVAGRALLACATTFLVYNVFVAAFPLRDPRPPNDATRNAVVAERYLHADSAPPAVVVGSSMAARLPADFPVPGSYNLALGGEGVATGLEIMRLRPEPPRLVLLESNSLTMPAETALIAGLTHPVLAPARRFLPAMRTENDPLIYLRSAAMARGSRSGGTVWTRPDPAVYAQMRAVAVRNYQREPEAEGYERGLREISPVVTELVRAGTRVIVFEMPVDSAIAGSANATFQRERIGRWAAEMGLPWIPADGTAYESTDGVHLTTEAARRYAERLRARLAEVTAASQEPGSPGRCAATPPAGCR